MKDPIVDEVRRFRLEHTRKCNYNLDTICNDIRAIQADCGHKIVRLPAKKITDDLCVTLPRRK